MQEGYAYKTVIKKLEILNNWFNMTYDTRFRVGAHAAALELRYSRCLAMGSDLEDFLEVAILIATLCGRDEYEP